MTALNDTEKYLAMTAGDRPGDALVNVRWRKRTPTGENAGMGSSFHHTSQLAGLAHRLVMLGQHTDVYVGVALRQFHSGSKRAVAASHLVWCEIDRPDAGLLLDRAIVPPTAVIASGGPGRLHAYWQLNHPYGGQQIEAANRALAAHLSGDPISTDIARILRPPGTVNHKRCTPTPVRLISYAPSRTYDLEAVTRGLDDPKSSGLPKREQRLAPRPSRDAAGRSADPYEALKALPPRAWVKTLSGESSNADGKVHCPTHPDQSPSLHLYNDGAWCFAGCGPVDIFGYAAAIWGLNTRIHFKQIKWLLAELLLNRTPSGQDQTEQSRSSLPRTRDATHRPAMSDPTHVSQGAER